MAKWTSDHSLRVLILDNEFPPLGGGTGVINYYVMSELDRYEQIRVDLVTSSRTRNRYEQEPFGKRGRIFKVPVNNRNIHHSTNVELLRYASRGLRQCRRLVRKQEASGQPYDLCWAYATVPAGGIAWALRHMLGLPYILITQGPDIPWYERRYYMLYPFLLPFIKRIWQSAAVVTAQSMASRDLILETSPHLPVSIVNNGVDTERFSPPAAVLEQRGRRSPIQFLCVGRLIERKGQQHLLQAARLLCQRGYADRFQVLLVGGGDNEQSLQALCVQLSLEDKVVFAGVVSRENMPSIYAQADVFVLPSYNEGMSVALLEALAAGLPVVATETGGTAELVQRAPERCNGAIVPWADPGALADTLEIFLSAPEMCREMGQYSQRIAGALSWEATAKAYVDLSYDYLNGQFAGAVSGYPGRSLATDKPKEQFGADRLRNF